MELRKRKKGNPRPRKLISFEKEIIDDVIYRLGDKYTRQQISDVLHTLISYINGVMRYTDVTELEIPCLGTMMVNVGQMKGAHGILSRFVEKTGKHDAHDAVLHEISTLEKKISYMEDYISKNPDKFPLRSPYTIVMKTHNYRLKRGLSFEALQDIQESEFS